MGGIAAECVGEVGSILSYSFFIFPLPTFKEKTAHPHALLF